MKKINFLTLRRWEAVGFLAVFFLIFGYMGSIMGVPHMLNTLMNTSYSLLIETVFYIMGYTVLSGGVSKLLIECGVVRLLEVMLRPIIVDHCPALFLYFICFYFSTEAHF